jgi:hypothetical protein
MYSLNRIVFWALMLAAVASGFVVKYNYILYIINKMSKTGA